MGAAAATQAGLRAQAYDACALQALGEQVLLDHLLHPGGRANALVGVAMAHGEVNTAARAGNDAVEIARQSAAFLAGAFKDEITVLDCLYDLAALKTPSRQQLARDVLARVGLEPGRLMNSGWRQVLPTPSNGWDLARRLLHGSYWESAAQFYFNADRLGDGDLQRMSPRPLDVAGLQRIRFNMPLSLKSRFESDYDRFVGDYARIGTRLLQAWIPAIAARQGIDLTNAHITIRKVHAQQYLKDTRVLAFEGPRDLGETRQDLAGHGYIVCIGPTDQGRRLFLSALDGRAHAIPAGMSLAKWVQRNTALVFGGEMEEAGRRAPHLKWRIAQEEVGHGRRADMAEWLDRGLRAEVEKHRDEARGQTWNEAALDLALNAIPLRATIMALKKGDYLQAGLAASMDAMVVLPLLAEGARAASLAVRAAVPLMRAGAGSLAGDAVRASAIQEDIAAILAAAMRAELGAGAREALGQLGPLDLDRLANNLRPAHPRLSVDLDAAAARARGMNVTGRWRASAEPTVQTQPPTAQPAPPAPGAGTPPDEIVSAPLPSPVSFTSEAGEHMSLLPYDGQAGLYTQVDAAGEPAGVLMKADANGSVHPLMPLRTFERYRIERGRLRNATLVRTDPVEGTVIAANQHYVAVGQDYVPVVRDRSLSSGRTVWRALAPRGGRADPVVHRLVHDREAGVWRRPEPAELGLSGGGGRAAAWWRLARRPAPSAGPPLEDTTAFREMLVREATGLHGPPPPTALKALLTRMQDNERGAAILRAMRAHHERHGEAPRIVLIGGEQARAQAGGAAVPARPTMAVREPTHLWHLDLNAITRQTTTQAVDELAAVYNNMTGILEPGHRLESPRGLAPLPAELEAVWDDWIAQEQDDVTIEVWDEQMGQRRRMTRREMIITKLRSQIQELRAYGGITRKALKQVMQVQDDAMAAFYVADGAEVNISARVRLSSLPPLPDLVRILDVSGTRITDWSNLPEGLIKLKANDCGLSRLPGNIPRSVTHLEVSQNSFTSLDLWEGLEVLGMDSTRVGGALMLPSSLIALGARFCQLDRLVVLSTSRLRTLDVSGSSLMTIRGLLPHTLEFANFSHTPALRVLPDLRRCRLIALGLAGVRLRRVPPVWAGLRYLDLSYNWSGVPGQELRITPDVMELADCEINMHFTGVTPAELPPPPAGRRGPTFLHLDQDIGLTRRMPRAIADVVAAWFKRDDPRLMRVLANWKRVASSHGATREFAEFRIFIDRLAETENAKDVTYGETFRAEVRELLVECAKPERQSLLETALAACADANQNCQDRTSWMFTQIKSLRLNDDIERGLYDGRVLEVILAAREAFIKDELEKLASAHADALDAARRQAAEAAGGTGAYFHPSNRLEIYLAYLVRFGPWAGIRATGSRRMRFFTAAGVSEAAIDANWPFLAERVNVEAFETFLSRNFFPWKALLKRSFRDEYAAAETAMQNTMEARVQAEINAELQRMGLDRADPTVARRIDEVVNNVGPQAQRRIEDATYQAVTRRFLQANNLQDLLRPAPLAPVETGARASVQMAAHPAAHPAAQPAAQMPVQTAVPAPVQAVSGAGQ